MNEIVKLISKHNDVRTGAINLIVSENRMSPAALAALSSDLASRYAAPFMLAPIFPRKSSRSPSKRPKNFLTPSM